LKIGFSACFQTNRGDEDRPGPFDSSRSSTVMTSYSRRLTVFAV
jgi:hypothetical protein